MPAILRLSSHPLPVSKYLPEAVSLDELGRIETRAQEVRSRYMDELDQGLGGRTLGSSNIWCHREGFIS